MGYASTIVIQARDKLPKIDQSIQRPTNTGTVYSIEALDNFTASSGLLITRRSFSCAFVLHDAHRTVNHARNWYPIMQIPGLFEHCFSPECD